MSFVDRLLVAGDRVVCKMDREARGWGRKGPPDGTLGTFRGLSRFNRNRARFGIDRHFYEPGIYEVNGSPIIDWDDGSSEVSGWDHEMADREEYERRYAAYHAQKSSDYDSDENAVKVGDLPETKFYELDIVRPVGGAAISFGDMIREGLRARIGGVQWGWEKESGHVYQVHWVDKDNEYANMGHTYLNDSEIELVERGNVWKEFHGEQLVFKSLKEEIAFAHGTGRVKEICNPATGLYSWTGREAIEAVRAGTADGINMGGPLLGLAVRPNLYCFKDRDLGERVRQATITGFAGIDDPDQNTEVA